MSESVIRTNWKKEATTIPESVFRELVASSPKSADSLIVERKPANWGQSKGALVANSKRYRPITAPKNVETAELVGAIIGDGNIYVNKQYNVYNLRIFADSRRERPWLEYLGKIISNNLKCRWALKKNPRKNCVFLTIQSRPMVDALISLGLEPGNKLKGGKGIPDWIKQNNHFLKACIRGLIDSDGSVYRLTPNFPHLTQLSFKSANRRLLNEVRESLISLGFHPSRITGIAIYLTRQGEIIRYSKEIGFKNPSRVINLPNGKLAPSSSGQI